MSATVLDRQYTPVEKHQLGDHRECGSSCKFAGLDVREAPIYDLVKSAHEREHSARHGLRRM